MIEKLANLKPDKIKAFALKRLPVYVAFIIVLIVFGVKSAMVMFFMFVSFFLGWTIKGLYQAFTDWRLTQRLNRVHFTQLDYETMERENRLLHEALNMFKENAKGRTVGAGVRNEPQAHRSHSAKMNYDQIRDFMAQMEDAK